MPGGQIPKKQMHPKWKLRKQVDLLGLVSTRSTNVDRSRREHEENIKRQQKRRAAARDIVSYIGYDAIYKDGIAQVEEGLYSQTIEFSDITYQSARQENQQNIFAVLSSLYNYFGADCSVQLTIANVPVPDSEIGCKKFFSIDDEICAPYAREYNKILNDKMREGASNLIRHRYITYMVGARSADEAAPRLSRIKGDVIDTLMRIRCDAHALIGEERVRVIQSQIRPHSPFVFSYNKLSHASTLCTKDFIAPALLDFAPDGRADIFKVDEVHGCVLSIRTFVRFFGNEVSRQAPRCL